MAFHAPVLWDVSFIIPVFLHFQHLPFLLSVYDLVSKLLRRKWLHKLPPRHLPTSQHSICPHMLSSPFSSCSYGKSVLHLLSCHSNDSVLSCIKFSLSLSLPLSLFFSPPSNYYHQRVCCNTSHIWQVESWLPRDVYIQISRHMNVWSCGKRELSC